MRNSGPWFLLVKSRCELLNALQNAEVIKSIDIYVNGRRMLYLLVEISDIKTKPMLVWKAFPSRVFYESRDSFDPNPWWKDIVRDVRNPTPFPSPLLNLSAIRPGIFASIPSFSMQLHDSNNLILTSSPDISILPSSEKSPKKNFQKDSSQVQD